MKGLQEMRVYRRGSEKREGIRACRLYLLMCAVKRRGTSDLKVPPGCAPRACSSAGRFSGGPRCGLFILGGFTVQLRLQTELLVEAIAVGLALLLELCLQKHGRGVGGLQRLLRDLLEDFHLLGVVRPAGVCDLRVGCTDRRLQGRVLVDAIFQGGFLNPFQNGLGLVQFLQEVPVTQVHGFKLLGVTWLHCSASLASLFSFPKPGAMSGNN